MANHFPNTVAATTGKINSFTVGIKRSITGMEIFVIKLFIRTHRKTQSPDSLRDARYIFPAFNVTRILFTEVFFLFGAKRREH